MLFSYYLGLDLGQATDYTALSIIEEPLWAFHEWHSPEAFSPRVVKRLVEKQVNEWRPPYPTLSLRHLERFELGTPYPVVVARVASLLRMSPLAGRPCALLVDKTGVGGAVVDMFEQAWLQPLAITIHGGSNVTNDEMRRGYRVPKRDLVGTTQILMQNRRLRIAGRLSHAQTLRKELLAFRMKLDPRTAHDSYEHWREGDHDDLVLATAIACWYREWYSIHLELAKLTNPEAFEHDNRELEQSGETEPPSLIQYTRSWKDEIS